MARLVAAVICAVMMLLAWAPAATAGGSWFRPLSSDVQPGDTVTLVGFTGGGTLTGGRDDTYFGFLDLEPIDPATDEAPVDPARLDVGELTLTATGRLGSERWRMHVTFQLPEDLPQGSYWFHYGADGDTQVGFGDLIGGVLAVGYPPSAEPGLDFGVHEADDPLVADLVAEQIRAQELALTGTDPDLVVLIGVTLAVAGGLCLAGSAAARRLLAPGSDPGL